MPAPTIPKPQTYSRGRLCAHDSCRTVLSSYNSFPRCWLHSNRAERLSLREHHEAMFDLADLMEQDS